MTLSEYLKAKKISQAKFAYRCNLSRATICRILDGSRYPSPETMRRIFLATDGEVKPNDFFTEKMRGM
jgi:transcriptional regulator with XRE-family HTH domain|tara:strand:- start:428 stop:631 length:204 start_codon:yes stop_codon:yes gene_type:complete